MALSGLVCVTVVAVSGCIYGQMMVGCGQFDFSKCCKTSWNGAIKSQEPGFVF